MMTTLKFLDQLPSALEERMRKDLIKYESSHGVDVNYKRFSAVLANDDGQEVGVLNAYTAFAEIYVDDMWVDSSHRGKGYGRKLIEGFEAHFKGQNFIKNVVFNWNLSEKIRKILSLPSSFLLSI